MHEGIVTASALAGALEEQARLQQPLGKVLVDLGLVSPGAIANALAEQYGAPLRTEYGISAGMQRADPPLEAVPDEPEADGALIEAWREAVAERDALLERLAAELRSRDAELAVHRLRAETIAEAEPEPEPEPEPAHVLFRPGGEGYELERRDGPAPAPGDEIDGLVVARLGTAPLPGETLRCAYLVVR